MLTLDAVPLQRQPVITGVGIVSAFGFGKEAFFDGLAAGRSAISTIEHFDVSTMPVRVGGEVKLPQPDLVKLVQHLRLDIAMPQMQSFQQSHWLRDRKAIFALCAAVEAWQDAGLRRDDPRHGDTGLVLALGLEQALLADFAPLYRHGKLDWSLAEHRDDLLWRSDIDWPARMIRASLGLRGAQWLNVSACAAGALAVAQAAALIRRGQAEVLLCGAADSMLNPLGLGGMARLGAPSPRSSVDACRPFDRRRDGLVIGEGAAMFVLESAQHAAARGARPLARVLGWGSTQDGYRATAPRPEGSAACRAMQEALADAGVPAEAVGYLNAHGTGTPLNDVAEARAIRRCFGVHTEHLPVSSIKGAIGHLMAAAGAIELAACLLPWTRGCLPGTSHHLDPDPDCALKVIGETPLPQVPEIALSNSFGFGGQNACVILGRA